MPSLLHVTSAEHRGQNRVWLAFDDGAAGEIDLTESLVGPVFEPLLDPETFAALKLDNDAGTIVWPNGADFAPEYLRSLLSATAETSDRQPPTPSAETIIAAQ